VKIVTEERDRIIEEEEKLKDLNEPEDKEEQDELHSEDSGFERRVEVEKDGDSLKAKSTHHLSKENFKETAGSSRQHKT